MVKIKDPLQALQEARGERGEQSSAEVATRKPKALTAAPGASVGTTEDAPASSSESVIKSDFRIFLTLLWRFRLGCDPTPAMLDLAWRLQHGPQRDVIEAFRGFSKSWITGAYALWLLYKDPQWKVLVVSGSLARAVANTNWCLMLILTWDVLAHLKPLPSQRSSSKAFDVGPALPDQSPSFHALGIGGQIVGFRADIIIADDVETQTNSISVGERQKNLDAVKEFDSVVKPVTGMVKFLGTPHDEDSLYNHMPARGYGVRLWPALYPTADQIVRYGDKLAPWIIAQMKKLGPGCVGTSIMPTRFTDDDLAKRKLSLGSAEFALQFMLDTSLSDRDKYPLKVKDLMVMSLDPRKGPESVTWSEDPKNRITDLPVLGFEGDHYHAPVLEADSRYAPWVRIVGAVDNSGRGSDETCLVILALLNGVIFLLYVGAWKAGFDVPTLLAIAKACVRFRVQKLKIESNFGDGMFAALLSPILIKEWQGANRVRKGLDDQATGTEIEEVRSSNQMAKEKRMLAILEPVTQQHRLVVDRAVIEEDYRSLTKIEGEDTRHRYSLMHQFTHLTRERDSLVHDDRLDALGIGVSDFADILGVDPETVAKVRRQEVDDEEYERLFGEDADVDRVGGSRGGNRAVALRPQTR